MKGKLLVIVILLISSINYGQNIKLIVYPHLKLPKDTLLKKQLLTSLDNFLLAAQKSNEENQLIYPSEQIETFVQLDEVRGIEKASNKSELLKTYLTSVVPIENNSFLAKVSYTTDTIPFTIGTFEFIARKTVNSFLFSSPFQSSS